MMLSALSLLLLAIPLAFADHKPQVNHRELAKRASGDLVKRQTFTNARWTFYSTGLGACGGTNTDSDFIVALNQDTFGNSYPSPYCWKMISMTYNGKTTQAQIVDSCPGCPAPGGLDLSPGLFSFFADESVGVLQGTWSFVDGSSDPTTTTSTHKATTHTTPTSTYTPPTTTSTYKPPTTTSTYTPPTTTSTTKSSTHVSSSSSASSSSAKPSSSSLPPTSASSNSLAAESGTVSATSTADPENLYTFSQLLLEVGGLLVDGANAE
ncbi:plant expansin [Mycena maculata]|uniref:Plant expansin n=1 Tax=Mycena maculata TaxID=230809 RepID=A0AAD7IBU5_9AGAR|nr:plant expansin [Mycena maculata]